MRSKSSMRLLAQVCLAPRRYGCAHRGSSIGGRTRVRDGFSLVDRASCGASTSCRMGRSTNAAHWRNISSRGGDGVLSLAAAGRSQRRRVRKKWREAGWLVWLHGAAAERSKAGQRRRAGLLGGRQGGDAGIECCGVCLRGTRSLIGETLYPPHTHTCRQGLIY